jgi:hypothetical protein
MCQRATGGFSAIPQGFLTTSSESTRDPCGVSPICRPQEVDMSLSSYRFGLLIASMLGTIACDFYPSPVAPSTKSPGPITMTGQVIDDSCLGPDVVAGQSCLPVSGARVEVVDGPDKGKAAMTGPDGRFDLGSVLMIPPSDCCTRVPALRAIKAGWSTHWLRPSENAGGFALVTLRIGQEPHVLFGRVSLSGNSNVMMPGVRVEIIGGPNSGQAALTDNLGFYRLNVETQDWVTVEFSKEGYVTVRSKTASTVIWHTSLATVLLQAKAAPS